MPPRKFTVEFKSARRRQKGPTNSIWGETDFKALAHEVKLMAPHLFNSTEATATPSKNDRPPVDPNRGSEVDQTVSVELVQAPVASGDSPEVKASKLPEPSPPASDAIVQLPDAPPVLQPRLRPNRRKRGGDVSVSVHQNKPAQTFERPISSDELAALEAENQRLRSLLAATLRAQNLQLKKMLERF